MKSQLFKSLCALFLCTTLWAFNSGMAVAYDITKPFPFASPPNTPHGTYEPSITADGKTIYFAQFAAPIGDPDPNRPGDRDIYVSHLSNGKWSEPSLLPAPINSKYMDTEPMISADGRTLHFMSMRPGGLGSRDIWVVKKKPGSEEWGEVQNMGAPINSPQMDHCFVSTTNPNGQEVAYLATTRPMKGMKGMNIVMFKKLANGQWSEPVSPGTAINTGQNQCRFVPGLGNKIGIVTDHDSQHHQEFLVRWDENKEEWVGPRIMAGWNSPGGQSEGCGRFFDDGKKWVWSSGRDRPAGYDFPNRYTLYWLHTDTMLDYYEETTGISVR